MINWHAYDVVIISTSGGKDSQTVLRHTLEQLADQDWDGTLRIVHADLRRSEWEGVTDLVRAQCEHYGVAKDLEIVTRPQGDLLDQVVDRGKWPGQSSRYCTSDQKTAQVKKVCTRLVAEWHAANAAPGKRTAPRRCRVANVLGLRAQESAKRAGREPIQPNARWSNKRKAEVDDVLPIHHLTEAEVWADIRAHGAPHHPAYDLGMPRLSCVFCIFATRDVLLLAGHENRDLLERYAQVERDIEHTFTQKISLVEILEAVERGEQPDKSKLSFGDMA